MTTKQELVKIYQDTLRKSRQFGGRFDQSTKYTPDELPDWEDVMREPTEDDDVARGPPSDTVHVEVHDLDTLTCAREQLEADPDADILVLNMAYPFCPGGGVKRGSRAQEECLFRCSNYHDCVNGKHYPLKDNSFIVTECVTVFKDEDYNVLRDPVEMDFIAMPAVCRPALYGGVDYLDEKDREDMKLRIDLIFRYAVLEQKDILVLGALGCGAFRNPPEVVREMFREAISKYGGYFKKIVFAVLSGTKNSNYEVFKTLE